MKENFNPAYNAPRQVRDCAGAEQAFIAIVIGYVPTKDGGGKFITSTDWRLKMPDGETAVFQFSIHPNYTSFVECRAGMEYGRERFSVNDASRGRRKAARVVIGDKMWHFEPEEVLFIRVCPNDLFIATDCNVAVEDTEYERIYHVIVDSNTEYGMMDEHGRVFRL